MSGFPHQRLSEITPDDPWPIVPGVAYAGKLTFWAAREGLGKSTAVRQCSAQVALGHADWLGRKAGSNDVPYTDGDAPGGVTLWIGEEGPSAVAAGFSPLDLPESAAHSIIVIDPDDMSTPDDMREAVAEFRPDLIVLDPAADVYRMEDERDYTRVRQTIRDWLPPSVVQSETWSHAEHGRWLRPMPGRWCKWQDDLAGYAPCENVQPLLDGVHGWQTDGPDVQNGWNRRVNLCKPAMIGILHCHRDRDARAGGGDQIGAYLGSVGYGSACDVLLELGLSDRKDPDGPDRYLRVCKSRISTLRRGQTLQLTYDGTRYSLRSGGVGLLSDAAREGAQIAGETRAFLTRNPESTKAQALKYLGVARGGTTKYRAFDEAFKAFMNARERRSAL